MTLANTPALHAAIVAHVQKFGPCSFKDIAAAIVGLPQLPKDLDALRLRLKRLTENGTLQATGLRENRRWTAADSTAPHQPDTLQKGWVPPAGPALRPGSDHRQIPSLRNGERVTQPPGYIFY